MKNKHIYISSIIILSCLISGQITPTIIYLDSQSTSKHETGSINYPFKTLYQAFSLIESNSYNSTLLYLANGENYYDLTDYTLVSENLILQSNESGLFPNLTFQNCNFKVPNLTIENLNFTINSSFTLTTNYAIFSNVTLLLYTDLSIISTNSTAGTIQLESVTLDFQSCSDCNIIISNFDEFIANNLTIYTLKTSINPIFNMENVFNVTFSNNDFDEEDMSNFYLLELDIEESDFHTWITFENILLKPDNEDSENYLSFIQINLYDNNSTINFVFDNMDAAIINYESFTIINILVEENEFQMSIGIDISNSNFTFEGDQSLFLVIDNVYENINEGWINITEFSVEDTIYNCENEFCGYSFFDFEINDGDYDIFINELEINNLISYKEPLNFFNFINEKININFDNCSIYNSQNIRFVMIINTEIQNGIYFYQVELKFNNLVLINNTFTNGSFELFGVPESFMQIELDGIDTEQFDLVINNLTILNTSFSN